MTHTAVRPVARAHRYSAFLRHRGLDEGGIFYATCIQNGYAEVICQEFSEVFDFVAFAAA